MSNPIENLGDYNKVRVDLQKFGGDRDALYKSIGETEVAKAAPTIFLAGCAFVLLVEGCVKLGKKGYMFLKERRQLVKEEANLKKQYMEMLAAEEKGA